MDNSKEKATIPDEQAAEATAAVGGGTPVQPLASSTHDHTAEPQPEDSSSSRRESWDSQRRPTQPSILSEPEEYEPSPDKSPAQDDAAENTDLERASTTTSNAPLYSVFPRKQKLFIVFMAAAGGFFSPLTAAIYFPALNTLATDLHVSTSNINLTLTLYMIFQGLAPTFYGDLADMAGRRPAYLIGFTIYIGACIGIALQDSFAALLILRCLQSSGSSGTIALATGVAADVATSAERGTYVGWTSTGALLGPAIGPILGGILAQYLGWRAIFWFLVIIAGVYMIPLILFFPETSRNVVGDGSVPPQGWNMSVLNWLAARRARKNRPALERTTSKASVRSAQAELAARRKLRFPNPLNALKILREPDAGLLLLFSSLVYTASYTVMSSTPALFADTYGFDDLQIGLSYIPYGVGAFIAPVVNGRLLDWRFRKLAAARGIKLVKGKNPSSLKDFPLERARVMVALPMVLFGDAALLCYGWAMDARAGLAAPLVLQFLMGLSLTGAFNVMSVMLVDYYPASPATAIAANNLVRCLLGAAGTAVIIQMIDKMGRGWCFTFWAGITLLSSAILPVLMRYGPGWREKRRVRMEAAEAAAASAGEEK